MHENQPSGTGRDARDRPRPGAHRPAAAGAAGAAPSPAERPSPRPRPGPAQAGVPASGTIPAPPLPDIPPAAAAAPSRRRPLLLAAAAVVALLAAATLVARLASSDGEGTPGGESAASAASATSRSTSGTATAPRGTVVDLTRWVAANIPPTDRVLADADAVRRLAAAGFPNATADPSTCRRDRFVLVTDALREQAGDDATTARCLRSTIAVALARDGSTSVEVRLVTSDLAAAQRSFAAAAADRGRGGAAIGDNPRITMSAEVRTMLVNGGLDLRAQTTLVALASQHPLQLERIVADPAEAAAGLPARTVEVHGLPADIGFSSQSTAFRPAAVTPLPGGLVRLTWSFTTAAVPVLD